MENQNWNITCSKENFEKVKFDETFLGLLSLARFVNALRFCQTAGIDGMNGKQFSKTRSTINSFLFASSVLYEGFLLIEKLSRTYKDTEAFQNGFGKLLRDKKIQLLRSTILKRARNKFVFHFDKDIASESLANFNPKEINFASSTGKATGEMYFGLADEISINYLLEPQESESDDSLASRYTEIVKDITSLIGEFAISADLLMSDVLKTKGFTVYKEKH